MVKNKRGFTLVELLAVLVILGLLFGLSLPAITRVFESSRNKMYITDTKKLISLAEYKINANNTNIEKPDPGDCIIISMKALHATELSSPPNGGEYLEENSFVVVKNNGGKLLYSATLVEKLKGGASYKGVKLTHESNLEGANAKNFVMNFKKNELLNPKTINVGNINTYLGDNYVSNIYKVYNSLILSSSTYNNSDTQEPEILSLNVQSASGKDFNSLDARIIIEATDGDSRLTDLKLSIYLIDEANPAVEKAIVSNVSYPSNKIYIKDVNLGSSPFTYDYRSNNTLKFKVVLVDPDSNSKTRFYTYKLHKDVAPVFDADKTTIKSVNKTFNISDVNLSLFISDEYEDELKVCFYEGETDDENACSEYVSYPGKTPIHYSYKCIATDGCNRDGSEQPLTVFAKDKYSQITKYTLNYNFSNNLPPEISEISAISSEDYYNTKDFSLKLVARDEMDISNLLEVNVSIMNQSNNSVVNFTRSYSDFYDGYLQVSLDSLYGTNVPYNGDTYLITVEVVDTEGASTTDQISYKIRNNVAPNISSFSVNSDGCVSSERSACESIVTGSRDVKVSFIINDDMDARPDEYVEVCLSEVDRECFDSGVVRYDSTNNFIEKQLNVSSYDGSTRTLYLFARDREGAVSKKSISYQLYKNKPPTFCYRGSDINTDGLDYNLNEFACKKYDALGDSVNRLRPIDLVGRSSSSFEDGHVLENEVYISLDDDIDGISGLRFNIVEEEVEAIQREDGSGLFDEGEVIQSHVVELPNNFSKNLSNNGFFTYKFSGRYDGNYRCLNVTATDTYGKSSSARKCFLLHKNAVPSIPEAPTILPIRNGGKDNVLDVLFGVEAIDDTIDDGSLRIQYCYNMFSKDGEALTTSEKCTDYYTYVDYLDSRDVFEDETDDSQFGDENDENNDSGEENDIDEGDEEKHTRNIMRLNKDNLFGDITSYEGQRLELFARVVDSEGLEAVSPIANYELYEDNGANILDVYGKRDEENNISLAFKVKSSNPSVDTYKICFSNESGTLNTCDSVDKFTGEYYAHSNNYNYINYTEEVLDELHLYVMDSNGKITSKMVNWITEACTLPEYQDDNLKKYQYESLSESEKISMDSCTGRCYAKNPKTGANINVKGLYRRKTYYLDLLTYDSNNPDNTRVFCLAKDEEVELNCSHIDCFLHNDNYQRKAIGMNKIIDDVPWTYTVKDSQNESNYYMYIKKYHYNMYISDYNMSEENISGSEEKELLGDEGVELTQTPDKVCFDCDDYFQYDSSSIDPFVHVNDFPS